MTRFTLSRRTFLAGASALAAAPSISLGQAQRVFKYAVVGCGGRGSGAVKDIRAAAERLGHKAVLVGASDFFQEKAAAVCKANGCDEKFAFGGAGGYKKVLELDAEIILLATPPIFRPLHLEACVKAGKHVFAEKPIATDAAGLRQFLKGRGQAKNLSIPSGTLHRYPTATPADRPRAEGRDRQSPRRPGVSLPRRHLGPPRRNKSRTPLTSATTGTTEMSGDQITEQAIHEVDLANCTAGAEDRDGHRCASPSLGGHRNIYDCMAIDYDYGDPYVCRRSCRFLVARPGRHLWTEPRARYLGGKITRFDGKECSTTKSGSGAS